MVRQLFWGRMSPPKIVGFSALYFLFFSGLFAYHAIRTLAFAQPDELTWYLSECPLGRLIAIFFIWIIQSPVMILRFLQMGIQALLLGFLTDWGIQFLRRHVQLFIRR